MADPLSITNIRDAFVNQSRPDRPFPSLSRLHMKTESGANRYAYMYWGKPMPSGSSIPMSKLRLWNSHAWAGTVTITVERLAAKWAASRLTWNNKPGVSGPTYTVTKTDAPANTMWEIDLRELMQLVSNGGTWYGVRVRVSGTAVLKVHSSESEMTDFRPEVLIDWSEAPDPPTNLVPRNGAAVDTDWPALSYLFTDRFGDTTLAKHHIQIDDTDDFLTPVFDTGWLSTSEPAFYLLGSGYSGLSPDMSRYWRVRVEDGDGNQSSWSEPALMKRTTKGTLTSTALGITSITNQVLNPGTETNTTSVVAVGAAGGGTRDTATFRSGVASYRRGPTTSAATVGHTRTLATAAEVGQVVQWAEWVRPDVDTIFVPRAALTIVSTATGSSYTGTGSPTLCPAGVWTRVVGSYTVATDRRLTGVGVITQASQAIGFAYNGDDSVSVIDEAVLPDSFSGDTPDTPDSDYAWVGVANASASTKSVFFVEDTTPTIFWSLTGRTQESYRVRVFDLANPRVMLYDSYQITGTVNTLDTGVPGKTVVSSLTATYRLIIDVWDTIYRMKTLTEDPVYSLIRDFVYKPGTTITPPADLTVTLNTPYPWVDLQFTRSTPPDGFVILRDGKVLEANLEAVDLLVSGTTYAYRDRTAPPRVAHTWTVVANQNGKDSQPSNAVVQTIKPPFTWMMNPDGSSPICLLKSASEKAPIIDAQQQTAQEVFQPIGGTPPVMVTQYMTGYEGHVEAVLADDVVNGLSARTMRDRFKAWKSQPGREVLLYNIDEVMRVVPYNMTYRPRAKSGGQIIYDVSFDFFQVDF